MSLIILRIAFALFGLVALATGAFGAFVGLAGFATETAVGITLDPASPDGAEADNTYRFFAGIWIGVGVMLLYAVLRWETSRALLLFGGLAIFIGGIGRIAPFFLGGLVPAGAYAPIVLELVVFPLLLLWDARVRSSRAAA